MKMTTEQLAATLSDIAQRVKEGDSFEGNLIYSCMEPELETGMWEVGGGYRVGNSEGQGGFRLLSGERP